MEYQGGGERALQKCRSLCLSAPRSVSPRSSCRDLRFNVELCTKSRTQLCRPGTGRSSGYRGVALRLVFSPEQNEDGVSEGKGDRAAGSTADFRASLQDYPLTFLTPPPLPA
ncbi:hypothetical protein AAFF_G00183290 [Aldrovandia affinis]|uniref:Uncharacterized protein n=1 Tax=Aldrovandia affinis TaxID=143900 RepID=A0AAD7RK70_9TELE|nr:hypothetical protein AAFF_G00183290 [Aldrovandia affinis]